MPVTSVIVPIPASGDGPIVSIATLVGSKTVVLSGKFSGTYILLASHDDATFFPVLTFDSDGEEKIEETLADSYKSVRVRASASAVGSVTLEISGLTSAASMNNFAVLASLPAGAAGDQGVIDTAVLFLPSGLEGDINFGCVGSFTGTILVEGSLNGFSFNTIGIFQAGDQQRSLFGTPARLEFEPLSTPDKTRYIRLSIQGQVFGLTTITVGGVVTGVAPSSTTLAQAYANGLVSADQTMIVLDAKGGTVTLDGTSLTGAFPYTLSVLGNQYLQQSLAVGVDAGVVPSARVHIASGSTNAGSSSLKLDPGFLMTAPESGAVESTGLHLFWTDAGGIRWQLDGGGGGGVTLAQAYSLGTMASDQTFSLLDTKGGALILNASSVGFTGSSALVVTNPSGGSASFPREGGFQTRSSVARAATALTTWDVVDFATSIVALTGGPATVASLSMVRFEHATINGPSNVVTDAYDLYVDVEPSGTATLTRSWSLGVAGKAQFSGDLAVGLAGAPSAWIHVTGGTAAAGSAPIKIDPGTLLAATESGAVESDGSHLYWTTAGGVRLQLDNGAVGVTLAVTYASGAVAADQTFSLLDVDGGGLIVDATAGGFTGSAAFEIDVIGGSVNFYRVGGFDVTSSISAAAGAANWNEVNFLTSTLTLTGGPAASAALAMVHVGAGIVNGVGNTVSDAYNLLVDAGPSGTATLTRSWSLGVTGAAQFAQGLVLGASLAPPGENDLVFGAGATSVSTANSGRLGYRAGVVQQFYASSNTDAYVPVLVGPAAGGFTQGSVSFGSASGQLTEDNANFFWDDANNRLGIDVAATPTASLHLPAGVAAAGGAPLKITHSGTLLTVPEPGAIESDPTHVYWTNAAGTRLQLDSTPVTTTLAQAYANGSVSADQTLTLLDAEGGMLIVDGTAPGFTGTYVAEFKGLATSAVSMPRDGGLVVFQGSIDSALPTTVAVTGGAHTNVTAGTEEIGALFNFSAIKTWATGAIATQREVLFTAPTYGFNAASVVTTAATVAITGAPATGVNATITNAYALWVQAGITNLAGKTAIGVLLPTATLHLAASTAAAGTASLKIPSGVVLTVTEPGAVEADNNHLYWTNAAGVRLQLDGGGSATTLAAAYAGGAASADQTLALLDTKGGGFVVDGTAGGFTGANALTVDALSAGAVLFPRIGGLSVQSSLSVTAALGATWNEVDLAASTVTLAGSPTTVTSMSMVHVGQSTFNGLGNTVSDAYNAFIEAAPITSLGGPVTYSQLSVGMMTITLHYTDLTSGTIVITGLTLSTLAVAQGFGALQDAAGLVLTSLLPLVNKIIDSASYVVSTGFGPNITGGNFHFYIQDGSDYTNFFTVTNLQTTSSGTSAGGQNQPIHASGSFASSNPCNISGSGPVMSTATLTRGWSLGTSGAAQFGAGIVLGAGLAPPSENDLVFGTGAAGISEANSGRLGYLAGSTQRFMVSMNGAPYVPLLTGPAIGGYTQGSVPFGSATGALGQDVANFFWDNTNKRLGLDVAANPTATLHLPAGAAAAGSAPLKITHSGTLLTIAEPGAVESDNNHLYWTNTAGARLQLDNLPGGATTLAQAYANGTVLADQTLVLLDAEGGMLVIDGTSGSFTGTYIAQFHGHSANVVSMPRNGGLTVFQGAVDAALPTTLTVTGGAHTNVTAGIEEVGALFNFSATKTWATGALATQREVLFEAPTYGFNAASVLTTAATVAITGAPAAGANATITTSLAFWVQSGSSQFTATQSVVSAAGANWNGINFAASTLTLTGATTPITTLNFVNIAAPSIIAASAVVTTDFFTCRIGAATFAGVGPASVTRNWSLGIDGNMKFGGGQNVKGTDVNVAGPYTVLATDYVLEVRYTTTAPISLNLPSIAIVGNGHIVISKDSGYNAAINNITLVPNGADTIENVAANYIQLVSGSAIWLKANATTNNWEII